MQVWGESDPEAALRFAETSDPRSRDRVLRSLARQLYQTNPELGERALSGIKDPKKASEVFFMSAMGDWNKMAESAVRLSDPKLRAAAAAGMLEALPYSEHSGRTEEVDRWAEALLDMATEAKVPIVFDSVLRAVTGETAERILETHRDEILNQFAIWRQISLPSDPVEFAARIDTLPDSIGKDHAIVNLAHTWSKLDPAVTAQWLTELPEGEGKMMGYRNVASTWARNDKKAALKWIDNLEDPTAGGFAASEASRFLAIENGKSAVDLAKTIDDPVLRQSAMTAALETWVAYDFESAVAQIGELELPHEVAAAAARAIEPVPLKERLSGRNSPHRRRCKISALDRTFSKFATASFTAD